MENHCTSIARYGSWYLLLTISKKGCKGEGKSFSSYEEVVIAYENKIVEINSIINFRLNGKWYKNTTVGRVILIQFYRRGRLY